MDNEQREFLARIVSVIDEKCESHVIDDGDVHHIQGPDGKLYLVYEKEVRINGRLATTKQIKEMDGFLKDTAYDISERIKSIVFNYGE